MNSVLRPPLPLLMIAIILTGCATEYGCIGMPEDPKCLSTTEAYQATDKALSVAAKVDATAAAARPKRSKSALPPTLQPVPKIDDPTPIRTPAQIMRIWIAPWEDSDGDLMVSNYIYTELEPRRWMIGNSVPTFSPALIPLQIEQRPPERTTTLDPLDRDNMSLPHHPRSVMDNDKDTN